MLVSVNPYKELEIYTKQNMERYRGVSFYEVSPHLWVGASARLCHPHAAGTCENRQTGLFPVPAAALKILGIEKEREDPVEGVV